MIRAKPGKTGDLPLWTVKAAKVPVFLNQDNWDYSLRSAAFHPK
jgi:hypothetical protein